MHQRKDKRGESDSMQGQFTAYLDVSTDRSKDRYLTRLHRLTAHEVTRDFQEEPIEGSEDTDLLADLPFLDILENEAILCALQSMSARDREVLLDLIVYEMKPVELARKLGLSYQGAMAVYYRARNALRKKLKGGDLHEF